jgi:hypothetical protein
MEKGLRLYDVQSYAEAIEEFKAGYAVDPAPDFLYAMAQAQRLSGDCFHAVLTYQSFLRTHPAERRAAPARQNIERCASNAGEATPAAPPPPVEPRASAPPEPIPVPAPAPEPIPPPRASTPAAAPVAATEAPAATATGHAWYDDGVGDALMIAGVVAAGSGLALMKIGADGVSSANATLQSSGVQYQAGSDAIQKGQSANTEQVAGAIAAGAGAALAAGGFIHVFLHDSGNPTVTCAPLSTGGFSLVGAGRF